MAGGGGNKKRFQYCTDPSGQEILNLRALQGHSGRNPIDLTLQDNVLIPHNFFEYIYHCGYAVSLHSITNSGREDKIPAGKNGRCSLQPSIPWIRNTRIRKSLIQPDYVLHCTNKSGKRHRDTVYWVDTQLAQRKGLKFYQTRSNAIIFHDTLPAYCIPKAFMMDTWEIIYEKVYVSPRRPQTISYRDNRMCDLDSDVAWSSKDTQRIQPKTQNPIIKNGETEYQDGHMQSWKKQNICEFKSLWKRSKIILIEKHFMLICSRITSTTRSAKIRRRWCRHGTNECGRLRGVSLFGRRKCTSRASFWREFQTCACDKTLRLTWAWGFSQAVAKGTSKFPSVACVCGEGTSRLPSESFSDLQLWREHTPVPVWSVFQTRACGECTSRYPFEECFNHVLLRNCTSMFPPEECFRHVLVVKTQGLPFQEWFRHVLVAKCTRFAVWSVFQLEFVKNSIEGSRLNRVWKSRSKFGRAGGRQHLSMAIRSTFWRRLVHKSGWQRALRQHQNQPE